MEKTPHNPSKPKTEFKSEFERPLEKGEVFSAKRPTHEVNQDELIHRYAEQKTEDQAAQEKADKEAYEAILNPTNIIDLKHQTVSLDMHIKQMRERILEAKAQKPHTPKVEDWEAGWRERAEAAIGAKVQKLQANLEETEAKIDELTEKYLDGFDPDGNLPINDELYAELEKMRNLSFEELKEFAEAKDKPVDDDSESFKAARRTHEAAQAARKRINQLHEEGLELNKGLDEANSIIESLNAAEADRYKELSDFVLDQAAIDSFLKPSLIDLRTRHAADPAALDTFQTREIDGYVKLRLMSKLGSQEEINKLPDTLVEGLIEKVRLLVEDELKVTPEDIDSARARAEAARLAAEEAARKAKPETHEERRERVRRERAAKTAAYEAAKVAGPADPTATRVHKITKRGLNRFKSLKAKAAARLRSSAPTASGDPVLEAKASAFGQSRRSRANLLKAHAIEHDDIEAALQITDKKAWRNPFRLPGGDRLARSQALEAIFKNNLSKNPELAHEAVRHMKNSLMRNESLLTIGTNLINKDRLIAGAALADEMEGSGKRKIKGELLEKTALELYDKSKRDEAIRFVEAVTKDQLIRDRVFAAFAKRDKDPYFLDQPHLIRDKKLRNQVREALS